MSAWQSDPQDKHESLLVLQFTVQKHVRAAASFVRFRFAIILNVTRNKQR